MHLRSEFGGLQEWHSIFGGENDVHQNKGERLGHIPLHHIYYVIVTLVLAPLCLWGASPWGGGSRGLKPRAESYSPFGAKTVPTPPYLSAIRDRSDKGESERRRDRNWDCGCKKLSSKADEGAGYTRSPTRSRRRQNWRNPGPRRVGQVGVVESRVHRTLPLARVSALSRRPSTFQTPS